MHFHTRARILNIVVIKLIAPKIEEAPARCKLKIAKSTDGPEWAAIPDNGGYTVHAVPAPDSTNDENNNKNKAGGNNQNLYYLIEEMPYQEHLSLMVLINYQNHLSL